MKGKKLTDGAQRPKQYISVSYRYLTSNKGFRIDALLSGKDKQKAYKALTSIHQYEMYITGLSWMDYGKLSVQQGGYESFNKDEFHVALTNNLPQDINDEIKKLYSCRFGDGDDFRLIGCRIDTEPVFYVLGFDLDFSAYKH